MTIKHSINYGIFGLDYNSGTEVRKFVHITFSIAKRNYNKSSYVSIIANYKLKQVWQRSK